LITPESLSKLVRSRVVGLDLKTHLFAKAVPQSNHLAATPFPFIAMADKPCAHFATHGCTTMVGKDGELCDSCQQTGC
jgi:hypothetical protein